MTYEYNTLSASIYYTHVGKSQFFFFNTPYFVLENQKLIEQEYINSLAQYDIDI